MSVNINSFIFEPELKRVTKEYKAKHKGKKKKKKKKDDADMVDKILEILDDEYRKEDALKQPMVIKIDV